MPTKKAKSAKTARATSASPKRKSRAKSADVRPEVDVLSPAAVINAYYICHNVSECLEARGFPWDGAKKGKKKKKKKK
ncbi:unnamed protein product [Rotaria socialis]|uniref:Small lysine-rich protein 1 n=1 Tax=Rotaria socialis TaxID=392032 RepID=A0A820H5N4_9BILA|nr:unnamed protein product [Rotaria socialis]CAF3195671.1 unnamed protein product [Rotaria socialis]CAF3332384.1 unnamed protein product [Rotaria socialis]CAF3432073.1 unnamed protein product [Rotaria socialis]CAF3480755.1 unnamed protein product [Rotaria socialis]